MTPMTPMTRMSRMSRVTGRRPLPRPDPGSRRQAAAGRSGAVALR